MSRCPSAMWSRHGGSALSRFWPTDQTMPVIVIAAVAVDHLAGQEDLRALNVARSADKRCQCNLVRVSLVKQGYVERNIPESDCSVYQSVRPLSLQPYSKR